MLRRNNERVSSVTMLSLLQNAMQRIYLVFRLVFDLVWSGSPRIVFLICSLSVWVPFGLHHSRQVMRSALRSGSTWLEFTCQQCSSVVLALHRTRGLNAIFSTFVCVGWHCHQLHSGLFRVTESSSFRCRPQWQSVVSDNLYVLRAVKPNVQNNGMYYSKSPQLSNYLYYAVLLNNTFLLT